MKKAIIIIAVIGVVGAGVGFYLYKSQNKLTDIDFDGMIGLSKNKGFDVFEDVSPKELKIIKSNYLKYFNRESHNDILSLFTIGEKKLSASQKVKLDKYVNKILKGLK